MIKINLEEFKPEWTIKKLTAGFNAPNSSNSAEVDRVKKNILIFGDNIQFNAHHSLIDFFKKKATLQRIENFYYIIHTQHINTDGDCIDKTIKYLKAMFEITLYYDKPEYKLAQKTLQPHHAHKMYKTLNSNKNIAERERFLNDIANYILAREIKNVYSYMFIDKDTIEEYKQAIISARESYKINVLPNEKTLAKDTKMAFHYYTKIVQSYFPKYIEENYNIIFERMLGFNKIIKESEEILYANIRN